MATNDIDEVKAWAHAFSSAPSTEKRDAYLGLKDTVIPGYDGVMRKAIEDIYEKDYKTKLAELGLKYHYELIDAQAARIVANPPERALWGVPDNTTGRKLYKLVNELKKYGIPSREAHVSMSRMSAGGGDQYGSFQPAGDGRRHPQGHRRRRRETRAARQSRRSHAVHVQRPRRRSRTGSARCFATPRTRTRKCTSA